MTPYDLRAATESGLTALVTAKAAEGRFLEFKRELPGKSHKAVVEFLADVSAFANASGGSLVFGVETAQGIPTEVVGLEVDDQDAEISRLENLLRTSIEPRLPSVAYRWVPLQSSRRALVMTIGRSWAAPHVVNYDHHWRFYSRNASGKYPLDVQEVRSQVLLAERATEQLRRFRADRIGTIKAGETPVQLTGSARLVLHLVPFLSLSPEFSVTTGQMTAARDNLWPLRGSWSERRYNVDGMATYPGTGAGQDSYAQAFRNGAVEVVEAQLLTTRFSEEAKIVPLGAVEEVLLEAIPKLLDFLESTGAGYPVALMLSLLNVQGFALFRNYEHYVLSGQKAPVEREDLILPDLVLETRPEHLQRAVQPLFDLLWNAGGFAASLDFDKDGNWQRPR